MRDKKQGGWRKEFEEIEQLRHYIRLCQKYKQKIRVGVYRINLEYEKGLIDHQTYTADLNYYLDNKSPEQWLNSYDQHIKNYKQEIKKRQEHINQERQRQTTLQQTQQTSLQYLIATIIVLTLIAGVKFMSPAITGFLVAENVTQEITIPENITEIITAPENITAPITNITNITLPEIINITIPEITNITLPIENITNITPPEIINITIPEITNITPPEKITEETIQGRAEIGKPVKWTKKTNQNITQLPKEAKNISITKITQEQKQPVSPEKINVRQLGRTQTLVQANLITGSAVTQIQENFLAKLVKELTNAITGYIIAEPQENITIIIEEPAQEYEIEYYTQAPQATEQQITPYKKQITISSEMHYTNILTYTTITEVPIKAIKLYRITEGVRELTEIIEYTDENNNGLIDEISWIVPSLSNETYEVIIEISKAEHLDENRIFISDIYEQVKSLDGVWSETIPSGNYVRVTFKQKLDSSRDITLYPRVVSGAPRIEVYEFNKGEKIAEFTSINSNEYNKVFLTNLQGIQDTFDLKILGGSVEFDYIVDPDTPPNITYDGAYTVYTFTANGTFSPPAGVTSVSVLVVAGGGGGGSRHGGGGGGGGLIYNSSYPVNGSNITVVVGAGGRRGWYAQSLGCGGVIGNGCPGENSTFGTLIAIGGGGAKTYDGGNANGGSGGGGAGVQNTAGGAGTVGQGNNGGNGCTNPSGGGGGGAGIAGTGCTDSYNGGKGGDGLNYTISGSNVYYAGGGGGGGESGYLGGNGSLGGGGHGGNLGSDNGGSNGTANTGGGGGGTRSILATEPGFFGGSGIVIVRFLTSSDTSYPIFSDYKDNSAKLVDGGIGLFNVTLSNTNGTVLLEINNTNITATNLTANVYNASYNFTNSGIYPYRWHSWGNGTNNNYNKSEDIIYIVNVTVDISPPIITLISPIDYANVSSIVNFSCTMTDVGGLKNSTLYGNWSGGWYANETKSVTGLINSTDFTKTIPDGRYIWNCYACDAIIISNCGFNSANKTFTVDTVSPSIRILYPSNNDNFSYNNINVNYTVSDNIRVQACWYTNSSGVVNYSIANCANLTTQIWPEGVNNITIYANDSVGNVNSSSVSFIVDTTDKTLPAINFINPTPGDGTTTANTSIIVNVSISEPSLQKVKYNWNGTNYTLYNDSLILMYNFDNVSAIGENAANIADVSKYGNNGTMVGAGFINDSGKYGKSLQLTGSNYLNTNYVQTEVTQYTIAVWVKTTNSSGVIVQDRGSGAGLSITLAIHPLCGSTGCTGASAGIPAIGVDSNSIWQGMNGNKRVDDGTWHHVVGVFNSTAGQTVVGNSVFFQVYIDGVLSNGAQGNQIGTPVSPLTGLGGTVIGYSQAWTQYFTSQLDELRIWNRSLSASEISQMYMSNLNKFNSTQWYLYVNQSQNSTTGLSNGTYTYFASAKDVAGNENMTETRTITIGETADATNPTWKNVYNNASTVTRFNGSVNWTANISDNVGLSYAWLEHNGTNRDNGAPKLFNESIIAIGGTSYNVSKQITINVSAGNYTCARYWFNDTSNNKNVTSWSCFTVASELPAKSISVTGGINFGSGAVLAGNIGAWLYSDKTSSTNSSWTWSAQEFIITNDGSSSGIITANASQNQENWIGTGADAFINGTESAANNGCSGNTATFNRLNTTNTATICSSLASGTNNKVEADVKIYIPSTIPSGTAKWTNVTFYIT